MSNNHTTVLTKKDFASDQEVRWCPGCGDYAILSQIQKVFPELGIPKEQFVVVSGIGCSSRFPYYMNTYGFHSIHGRAPAIATGTKLANPELSVWIATGDGDALSIGGNHFIHILRRNIDLNILLFNNRIYGLTKGQYSPTSEIGKVTSSTPMGSIDYPFNPPSLAIGSGGTYIARTIDREIKHMSEIFMSANKHKGTSFIEIYQNCNIFNDGAFSNLTEKEIKAENQLILNNGEPMLFGINNSKGIILEGSKLKVISINSKETINDVLVHDKNNRNLAMLLADITYNSNLPVPIGVIYEEIKQTYEDAMYAQIEDAKTKKGIGSINKLLKSSGNTWKVS